ncbi:hypothetical protein RIF29_08235 [Crotalaria pallida]|uniref:Uncharacterized protein n=1 Tax=Crotalaria pallida TaxID=3830 RepID=A0AAN9J629_CROPI
MGANLCTLWCPISEQNSKSRDTRARTGSSFKEFIKPKCMKKYNRRSANTNLKRKKEMIEMDGVENKIPKATKLTLEDWLLASPPGLKPDYKKRGELCAFKQSAKKKKVHPCSSQCRGSSLGEAKDSLSLERPMLMNPYEKSEAILSTCSSSVSGKSRKRVRFKLPHVLILYSPDEPWCKEASLSSPEDPYYSDDSFPSPERLNSFDIAEEPYVNGRLAVDTLPRVFVSSRNLKQECSCIRIGTYCCDCDCCSTRSSFTIDQFGS